MHLQLVQSVPSAVIGANNGQTIILNAETLGKTLQQQQQQQQTKEMPSITDTLVSATSSVLQATEAGLTYNKSNHPEVLCPSSAYQGGKFL